MLQKLMDSPVAWLVLAIISVVSFIIAIYEIVKKKSVKELSYYDSSYVIVKNNEDSISKMAIMYDGKEVENVTISKFAIWNSGTETLKTDDLVEEKMIKFKAENGAKILDAQIIAETDEYNKFTVSTDSKDTATVSFDWTAKQDGCVLQLLHTGDASDIIPDSEIKGGEKLKCQKKKKEKNGKRKNDENDEKVFITSKKIIIIFMVFVNLLFLLVLIGLIPKVHNAMNNAVNDFLRIQTPEHILADDSIEPIQKVNIISQYYKHSVRDDIIAAIASILCIIIMNRMFIYILRNVFLIKIPKNLRPFIEDESKYFNKK